MIELLNYRASTLTGETMAFLQVLCDYAAIAIQNVRAVERIQELTITDDCTGLFNSRHLFSVTEVELERSRRFNLPFSLIFIDLDHFKRVNDLHGHLTGSRLLAEIARTIKHNVRGIDSAFRYGGDEFIVLLPQTGKDAALEVTQRLVHALRDTHYLLAEGLEVRMMASFGIASYPEDGSTIQEIIGAADQMMYLVKILPGKYRRRPARFYSSLKNALAWSPAVESETARVRNYETPKAPQKSTQSRRGRLKSSRGRKSWVNVG